MNNVLKAAVAAGFMCVSALAAPMLIPQRHLSEVRAPKIDLENNIPRAFAGWKMDPHPYSGVVDQETADAVNRIYSQNLSRTYVNAAGQSIMLVIAYGDDQRRRDGLQLHYPEICYPAQGFEIRGRATSTLNWGAGALQVRQLETSLHENRREPVTYWTMTGEHPTLGGLREKFVELNYGVHGTVPDGLLFRVSSIGRDTGRQFDLQSAFVRDLMTSLDPGVRRLFVGT